MEQDVSGLIEEYREQVRVIDRKIADLKERDDAPGKQVACLEQMKSGLLKSIRYMEKHHRSII